MTYDARTVSLFTLLVQIIERRNVDGLMSLEDYRRMVGVGKTIAKRTGRELEDVLQTAGLD